MSIFELLLQTSFTTTQLQRRANLVRNFYEKYIYGNPKPHPQDFFTNPLDWQWFLNYQSSLYQALANPDARENISEIDRKTKSLKPITCFTAVQIPEEMLSSIVSHLRQDLGPDVILKTRTDPAIIGGCVLIKDGLVKDYSIRHKLNSLRPQLLQQFQEAIPK